MFQITGVLKAKFSEQKVSDSFKKRDFVVTENSSQYPQHINFQLVQDKCSLIDSFNEGDTIKVSFNLRGREWTSPQNEVKYFNTLDAWRIENADGNQNVSQPSAQSNNYQAAPQNTPPVISSSINLNSSQEDDLPF
jgi:translation initiation factor IF-3